MKTLASTFGLFLLSMFVLNNSMAQKANYTTGGGITIGFGAGYAYQKSDLANSKGLGLDFTLGSPLYQRENAFLRVDWKFRFMAGENRAYDHRINPDYTYSNIRYSFFNYDLELGLTLNRLRERTGIVLSGFTGAGITHGRTYTDLFDAGNNLYDFESIDPDRSSKLVYEDLVSLSDGEFETRLVNKAAFLPTAGLFFGYQFSRSITLGIEYKTNFYLTEKNSFTGIDLDNRIMNGSGIDRNNYVSLGLRWNLRGSATHRRASKSYPADMASNYSHTTLSNNLDATASRLQPSVHITDPSTDAYHTESAYHTIQASINHVSGTGDISFYLNGFLNNNFTYNERNQLLTANVRLREGENRIRIKATCQGSTDEDLVTITLDHPADAVIPAPSVEFSSPQGDRVTTSSDRIDVTARVKNISSKEDIQLILNGSRTAFEYYPVSGLVKATVTLINNDNNLFIRGSNGSGSAQDQLAIYVKAAEDIAFPTVRFIHPAAPVEVNDNLFSLSAEIENVFGRNDISMRLNGNSINNFSFDAHGMVSVNLLLPEGINTLEIIASNEAGFTSESTSITYYRPVRYEPVQNVPVQYAPVQTPIVHAPPVQTPPVQYAPVYDEPVSQQPVSQEPVTREPLRQPVTHEPVTRQPVTHEPVAREPIAREPIAREPIARKTGAREGVAREGVAREGVSREGVIRGRGTRVSVSDEPVTINPVTTNPVATNPVTTNPVTTNPVTTNPVTTNPVATNPVTTNPVTTNPVATNPVTTNPVTTNPVATNPVATNPVTTNPVTTNPVATNPVATNPVATNPVTTNPVATNPVATNPVATNPVATNPVATNPVATNPVATNPVTTNPVTTNPVTTNPVTTNPVATNPVATNPVSTNPVTTNPVTTNPVIAEEETAIRINPGNDAWQFCLATPSGTFSRENLANANFSYSGQASSLYFMPIGGGGTASVNGKSFTLKSGQYYLFTGNLQVSVSTHHRGAMGQWSVHISADRQPVTGNGNNRPKSPCETDHANSSKEKKDRR